MNNGEPLQRVIWVSVGAHNNVMVSVNNIFWLETFEKKWGTKVEELVAPFWNPLEGEFKA